MTLRGFRAGPNPNLVPLLHSGRASMRKLPLSIIAFALLIGLSSAAFAHARLVKSQPRNGSIVKVAPGGLTLWFSEALEPAFCTIEVVNESGNRFDQGQATTDASDAKILHV